MCVWGGGGGGGGGGVIDCYRHKKQLSSPIAVGDNGEFTAFFLISSTYNCGRTLNVRNKPIKSEEIINFCLIFL